jgi:hypothetical protein
VFAGSNSPHGSCLARKTPNPLRSFIFLLLPRAPNQVPRCDRRPRVSVSKTLKEDEGFFMIRSRSVHLGELSYLRGKGSRQTQRVTLF